MKKYLKWILVPIAIVVFFLGTSFLYQYLSEEYDPQNIVVNDEKAEVETESSAGGENSYQPVDAPDFTVQDWDGNAVNRTDYVGKPVVVNFWASWCPPCKGEMPDFEAVYQKYGDDVQFMMVNLTDGQQETTASAKAYIEGQGYTFPVYFDTEMSAAIAYGVSSVPQTYFFNAEGKAVVAARGAIDAETLEYAIGIILE